MLYEKNIWIDFEKETVYGCVDKIPKNKLKNFVEVIPDYCKGTATCNARENFQLYISYNKKDTLYIDWKRHFWTNSPTALLKSLSLNDWLNLFKRAFVSGANMWDFIEKTNSTEYNLNDIIVTLYEDNITFFSWNEE